MRVDRFGASGRPWRDAPYPYAGGRDTHDRLHGAIGPWRIGTDISSGRIRFSNHDIVDAYVRVLPSGPAVTA